MRRVKKASKKLLEKVLQDEPVNLCDKELQNSVGNISENSARRQARFVLPTLDKMFLCPHCGKRLRFYFRFVRGKKTDSDFRRATHFIECRNRQCPCDKYVIFSGGYADMLDFVRDELEFDKDQVYAGPLKSFYDFRDRYYELKGLVKRQRKSRNQRDIDFGIVFRSEILHSADNLILFPFCSFYPRQTSNKMLDIAYREHQAVLREAPILSHRDSIRIWRTVSKSLPVRVALIREKKKRY
jgi:hypothetical protein